jgi:hypothetical protein
VSTQQTGSRTGDATGVSTVTGVFRRPVIPRQRSPQLRTLAGLATWAAALGLGGLVMGLRGLILILATHPPQWYEPTMVVMGLLGIGLTVGAFLTVQHRYLPWALLGLSTADLIASMIVTGAA